MKHSANSPAAGSNETARHFLNRETSGGLLLMVATAAAILIANSRWGPAYQSILGEELVIGVQNHLELELSLETWINDGLMVIFFLVAGLEIKREVLVGELSTFKKAAMPIIAAVGGMLFPALFFTICNAGTDTAHGWGIPMATDIAYSLGVISLLGRRVPASLRIFLVSLAIADDLGAILVIAVFYSSQIAWMQLALAGVLLAVLVIMNLSGVKYLRFYVLTGIAFWLCFIHSGIHPTIAGVLLAFTIPVRPKMRGMQLRDQVQGHISRLESTGLEGFNPLADPRQHDALQHLGLDARRSQPVLLRLEDALTGFNSFVIIPAFALANAGVRLDVNFSDLFTHTLSLGIILGLVCGKVIGITSFSLIAQKLQIATLAGNLSWKHITGAGLVAGVGFTMSLFITNLALEDPEFIKLAKISILLASLMAICLGGTVLFFLAHQEPGSRTPARCTT